MVFGRHFVLIFIAIGAVEWLDMARIARGQTLSLKQREYVLSARALGASAAAIIWRHILPNASGPIIAYLTLLVPRVILLESFISFLGLGVQEPLRAGAFDRGRRAQHSRADPFADLPGFVSGRDARRLAESRPRAGAKDGVPKRIIERGPAGEILSNAHQIYAIILDKATLPHIQAERWLTSKI